MPQGIREEEAEDEDEDDEEDDDWAISGGARGFHWFFCISVFVYWIREFKVKKTFIV